MSPNCIVYVNDNTIHLGEKVNANAGYSFIGTSPDIIHTIHHYKFKYCKKNNHRPQQKYSEYKFEIV